MARLSLCNNALDSVSACKSKGQGWQAVQVGQLSKVYVPKQIAAVMSADDATTAAVIMFKLAW